MKGLGDKFFLNAVGSIVFKGIAGLIGFLSSVVIARFLGAEQAGMYFLVFAILGFLSVVGKCGVDRLVLRLVSIGFASNLLGSIKGIIVISLNMVFGFSLFIAAVIWIFSDFISVSIFDKPDLSASLRYIALTIPLVSLSSIMAEALQGLHRFFKSAFILSISPGFWLIFILCCFYNNEISVNSKIACKALFFSYLITFFNGLYFLRSYILTNSPSDRFHISYVLKECWPLYITDFMAIAVLLSSQVIAGYWLDAADLAHFAAAQRTASLTSLLLLALNLVVAPRYAALYHQGHSVELRRLAQFVTLVVTLIAVPIVAVMCVVPSQIMSLFGADFSEAGRLLQILAVGQLINAMTGSVGYLLVMSGHQNDMRNITLVSGILAILLPLLLLPDFGVYGAAISTSLALSFQNILSFFYVKKRLGFWTFTLSLK